MKVTLNVGDLLAHYSNVARSFMTGFIPTEDKVAALIQGMAKDVAHKREEWIKALTARNLLDDPDVENTTDKGTLATCERLIERRERQYLDWSTQFKSLPDTPENAKERAGLETKIRQAVAEKREAETQLGVLRSELQTREETLQRRKESYDKAKEDLDRLRRVGPTLVAQLRQLEDSATEKRRALADKDQGTVSSGSANVIAELQEAIRTASVQDKALTEIEDDPTRMDLDQISDAEMATGQDDDLVNKLLGR